MHEFPVNCRLDLWNSAVVNICRPLGPTPPLLHPCHSGCVRCYIDEFRSDRTYGPQSRSLTQTAEARRIDDSRRRQFPGASVRFGGR